jgi:hemolysin activation/secretion protein
MNKLRLIPHRFSHFLVKFKFVFLCCLIFAFHQESNAQQTGGKIIAQANIAVPNDLSFKGTAYADDLTSLKGLSTSSPRIKQVADKISSDLRNKGFTFNRVVPTFSSANGLLTLKILVGRNGDAFVTGNDWLSGDNILKYLAWDSGNYFNYSAFQSSASNLNSNRFVNVDSKLKPRRSNTGEIFVDADFKVEDSIPLVTTVNFANDGNAKSSGWRSTLGLEWWEPFYKSDKISFSWMTDPQSTSTLNSFSAQYLTNYSDTWTVMMFTGYSESEYNDVLSPISFDISGEGLFAGVMVSNQFADLDSGPVSWNLGLTYLDLENSFSFTSAPASDDVNQLSFVVLRAGLQGVLNNQDMFPGKSFWSLSALTDARSSSDADLKTQRPGASSGFIAGQFAFTTLQNISDRRQQIDLYLNFASQFASDALPSSLQKAIGGVNSVRGYDEREAFGDHGFHLNSELRFGAFPVGKKGRIEPFTFFDVGYVSSEESLSGVKDSASMQSAGAGFRCIFKPSLDLDFHLGVPFKESVDTKKSDAHLHFNLDFRF